MANNDKLTIKVKKNGRMKITKDDDASALRQPPRAHSATAAERQ